MLYSYDTGIVIPNYREKDLMGGYQSSRIYIRVFKNQALKLQTHKDFQFISDRAFPSGKKMIEIKYSS